MFGKEKVILLIAHRTADFILVESHNLWKPAFAENFEDENEKNGELKNEMYETCLSPTIQTSCI